MKPPKQNVALATRNETCATSNDEMIGKRNAQVFPAGPGKLKIRTTLAMTTPAKVQVPVRFSLCFIIISPTWQQKISCGCPPTNNLAKIHVCALELICVSSKTYMVWGVLGPSLLVFQHIFSHIHSSPWPQASPEPVCAQHSGELHQLFGGDGESWSRKQQQQQQQPKWWENMNKQWINLSLPRKH